MDEDFPQRTVKVVAPAAHWLGGKKQLGGRIVDLMGATTLRRCKPCDVTREPARWI